MSVDHARVSDVLRRFAGTLVGEFDLDDVLAALGLDVAEILGAAGAGVMLADPEGHLHFVATSDDVLGRLEQLQIELDEGPCLLAYRASRPIVASDLTTDERFPRFGPRAVEAGMGAVWSFPMHLEGTPIGALNLYAASSSDLSEDAIATGQTFADVATIYATHAQDLADHHELTAGLQKALDTRVVVEQAKGYLAAACGQTPGEAYELLRRYARARSMKVKLVSRAVLAGEVTLQDLTADRR